MKNVCRNTFLKLIFCFGLFLLGPVVAKAQLTPLVDSITMRDGKKLAADIYIPTGCNTCPTIIVQTPYNRTVSRTLGLPLGIGMNVDTQPYIWVLVDWRGFYGSLNAFTAAPNRGEDGYDVVDWVVNQSWSNGEAGTWGPSALGRIQFQTAREQHPGHVCAVPLVASTQFNYDEYYPGGVYRTEYVASLDALGFGMSTLLLAHPTRDLTWQFLENDSYYPTEIDIPMLMIGGWYDHASEVMIEFFDGLQTLSPTAVRDQHRLVMGPWAHGGFGTAQVGSSNQGELFYPEAAGWSDSLALAFFDFHLLGASNGWDNTPAIQSFLMGDNVWEGYAQWPPTGNLTVPFYLHEGNLLSTDLPPATGTSPLIYDPSNPSPTVGGPTLTPALGQGPYDLTLDVESRSDIVLFTSDVLSNPITFRGKPTVKLWVNTDKKDTDFAIRLTDVYPDGRSMLLSDDIMRMRFRDGFGPGDTSATTPGTIYEITLELPDQAHTFLAGHQIRLDVSSSNYPRFDKNLNNGGPMYTAGDTLVAHNMIFHRDYQPSRIEFPLDQSFVIAEEEASFYTIFPNPSDNNFTIQWLSSKQKQAELRIFGLDGKLLHHQHLNANNGTTHAVETSHVPSGLYLLEIETEDSKHTKRLIIQHH